MVIDEDLWAANGLLLAAKGQAVSEAVIARLQNFSKFSWNDKPFSVRVPLPAPGVAESVPVETYSIRK
jgi:hypothetical protein